MNLQERYTTHVPEGPRNHAHDRFNWARFIIDAVVLLIAFILLNAFWPAASVDTGYRGVVTSFGEIIGIENEGLHFILPWRKLSNFSIRAETAAIKDANGSTYDTQPVDVSLTVRYSIYPDKVAFVFEHYSHTGDLSSYVQTATQEVFKAVTAKYVATDLIAKRLQVSEDIRSALQVALNTYGAEVVKVDMTNFSFSPSYMAAINDKVTQEQKRLAAENKLRTVEAEQKQKVAVAEAEATAIQRRADGDAYALLKNATAQADALKVKNAALAQSTQILELQRIQVEQTKAERWNGQLPVNVYAGAPIPFFNVTGK